MRETRFTAGPWHAADRGIGWEVHVGAAPGADPKACWEPDAPVCQTINAEFRDTFSEPDARLIAAAPDLYAALRTHGAHLRDCAIYDPQDPGRCNCGLDAALRKAEGR